MRTINGVIMHDPDKLHDFARFITRERNLIVDATNSLIRVMNQMNETWRDAKNKEFTSSFAPHITNIEKLAHLLEEHSKFVELKASQIDDYNNFVRL